MELELRFHSNYYPKHLYMSYTTYWYSKMGTKIAFMPFFGGNSTAAHSKREKRLDYLRSCYNSVVSNGFKPFVIVCTTEDMLLCRSENMQYFVVDVKSPEMLAAEGVIGARLLVGDDDIVFYTEADQILHMPDDFDESNLTSHTYYVPHRLEQCYLEFGKARGDQREINGVEYVVVNSVGTPYPQFAGCFLCRGSLFKSFNLTMSRDLPVEHATGLDIAFCGTWGKHKDLYVIHLSGYEYHQKLAENANVGN